MYVLNFSTDTDFVDSQYKGCGKAYVGFDRKTTPVKIAYVDDYVPYITLYDIGRVRMTSAARRALRDAIGEAKRQGHEKAKQVVSDCHIVAYGEVSCHQLIVTRFIKGDVSNAVPSVLNLEQEDDNA